MLSATPSISSVSGTVSDGQAITVSGSSFGSTGPTVVIFDNFEGGSVGSLIKTGAGSATVGTWSSIHATCQPTYGNSYFYSGSQSFTANNACSTDGSPPYGDDSVSTQVTGLSFTDAYYSYWVYLPVGTQFPCLDDGTSCNWKILWIYNTAPNVSYCCDLWLPVGNPTNQPSTINAWNIQGNNWSGSGTWTGGQPGNPTWFANWTMNHGKWYRIDGFVHATADSSSYLEMYFLGKDESIPRTLAESFSGQLLVSSSSFDTLSFNAFQRPCVNRNTAAPCSQTSMQMLDDFYFATGSTARARVEIGNANTYNGSNNITLCTVNSWSATSIGCTIRKGSFNTGLQNNYLYVVDGSGNVNASGFLLNGGGGGGGNPGGGNTPGNRVPVTRTPVTRKAR